MYLHSWFNPCFLSTYSEQAVLDIRHRTSKREDKIKNKNFPAYDLCDKQYGDDYNPNISYILGISLHNQTVVDTSYFFFLLEVSWLRKMSGIQEDEFIKLILNLDSFIRVYFNLCGKLAETIDFEALLQGPNIFHVRKHRPPELSFSPLLGAEETKYKTECSSRFSFSLIFLSEEIKTTA